MIPCFDVMFRYCLSEEVTGLHFATSPAFPTKPVEP